MSCKININHFLEKNCQNIWSILNQEAKKNPPKGFQEFLLGESYEEVEERKDLLRQVDGEIARLINRLTLKVVGDTYRRDLSGADSENNLAEFFCEIALVDSLTRLSSDPVLRPKTKTGTACDIKVMIDGCNICGDSKRLEDRWEGGSRSISKSPPRVRGHKSTRPRSMDLYDKLKDTPRQFPVNTLNVIFLFHPSYWNTQLYIKQALFGDNSFLDKLDQPLLHEDGLYSLQEWQTISACIYSRVNKDGSLSFDKIWKNPNALVCLQDNIVQKIKKAR
jgi:hypothetical protein